MSDDLEEAKATGEDSIAADATNAAGGAVKPRKGDVKKSVDPTAGNVEDKVKTPQGSHDVGLKEAVAGLFEGTELSEEFKTKTVAIFEAAVSEKISSIREELEEQFDTDLQEQVALATEEIVEKVDSYLDYVVERWIEQNEVAVESNLKVQVAESLINGLKGLVVEHNMNIKQETIDAVAEMQAKLDEQTAKYNSIVESLIEVREEKENLEREVAFNQLSEGLTDTEVAKLRTLSEGVSFDTVSEFKTKVAAIKESYFVESAPSVVDETELLEEEVIVEGKKVISTDPAISFYATALNRFAK